MKKRKWIAVLSLLFAIVLVGAAGVRFLPSAYADQYQIGDAEISENIRSLKIDWTSGAVQIAYHSKDTILIQEKSDRELTDDTRLCWKVQGDTLEINYQKPGWNFLSFVSPKKELTVTLPQSYILTNADISATSADVTVPSLLSDSLKLKSTSGSIHATVNAREVKSECTSGDMELQVMNEAEEISLKSTSGDMILETEGAREKVKISSTSGDIRVAMDHAGEFEASSTSGDIHAVIGKAKEAKIHSTSGKVTAEFFTLDELNIHTTSGSVEAYLPAEPGFTAHLSTTSGRIDYQLPLQKAGGNLQIGDGSGQVEIHTTSGNITLYPRQ